jgi:hypothetical protein
VYLCDSVVYLAQDSGLRQDKAPLPFFLHKVYKRHLSRWDNALRGPAQKTFRLLHRACGFHISRAKFPLTHARSHNGPGRLLLTRSGASLGLILCHVDVAVLASGDVIDDAEARARIPIRPALLLHSP